MMRAIDPADYSSAHAFEREKRAIFARAWWPIAMREQLALAGQFVAMSAGGWPMLAVCGADGVVRAFRNLCRHQESPLVAQDGGRCEQFRCRAHGWTYDLAGALAAAPAPTAPPGDHAQYGLAPLALREWGPVLLAHWQAQAAAPALPRFAADGFEGYPVYAGARLVDIACNWKTLLELMLPAAGLAWCWPALLVRAVHGALCIDRIAPRAALRTRLTRHVYLACAHDAAAQEHLAALDAIKGEAQQWQAARAQGCAADVSHPPVAELHARLASACAGEIAA